MEHYTNAMAIEKGGHAFCCPDTHPVFDYRTFSERVMCDHSLMEAVVQTFLENIPFQIASLSEMLKSGDTIGVRQVAHNIRGAAATISAEQMVEIAKNIGNVVKNGNLQLIQTAAVLLKKNFNKLVIELKKYNLGMQRGNYENVDC